MAERPEDLNLPIAVINRLVKEALPDGVNVSKEARTAISKAASVFVLYATSCANNFALKAKRKTLTGQDVLSAMADMEFDRFVEPLEESLEAYRRDLKGRKDAQEKRKREKANGGDSKKSPENVNKSQEADEEAGSSAQEEEEDEDAEEEQEDEEDDNGNANDDDEGDEQMEQED